MALFPELRKVTSVEQELQYCSDGWIAWARSFRAGVAKQWREGRAIYFSLNPTVRAAVKHYWQICGYPGDAVYFIGLAKKVEKNPTYIFQRLRIRCYYRLHNEGRLPLNPVVLEFLGY